MDVVKIGLLGVLGVLLAVRFKTEKQEYGLYIGIVVSLLILGYVVENLQDIWSQIAQIQTYVTFDNSYFTILLKVIGITYICEFCAAICKDAGYSAISGQIEMVGKLSVLLAGVPILLAVIENIHAIGS